VARPGGDIDRLLHGAQQQTLFGISGSVRYFILVQAFPHFSLFSLYNCGVTVNISTSPNFAVVAHAETDRRTDAK